MLCLDHTELEIGTKAAVFHSHCKFFLAPIISYDILLSSLAALQFASGNCGVEILWRFSSSVDYRFTVSNNKYMAILTLSQPPGPLPHSSSPQEA